MNDREYLAFRRGYNAGYRTGSKRDIVDRLTTENINLKQQLLKQ